MCPIAPEKEQAGGRDEGAEAERVTLTDTESARTRRSSSPAFNSYEKQTSTICKLCSLKYFVMAETDEGKCESVASLGEEQEPASSSKVDPEDRKASELWGHEGALGFISLWLLQNWFKPATACYDQHVPVSSPV